jgi:hypothetical protein
MMFHPETNLETSARTTLGTHRPRARAGRGGRVQAARTPRGLAERQRLEAGPTAQPSDL